MNGTPQSNAAAVLGLVFGDRYAQEFSVCFWDGSIVPAQRDARFTLCVNDPGTLRAAFRPPVDLNVGRAFAAGLLDVQGDIEAGIDELYAAAARLRHAEMLRLAMLLRRLPKIDLPELREAKLSGKRHSIARDRAAVGFHYDQPVEFYRAFLDRDLVYSCAYFDDGIETLDEAQQAKIDHSLRKLRLRPGERLLDIGCGWGALVVRAAEKFGARVLGVTLSERQCEEARRRIREADLTGRASVELRDYRELGDEPFDKIVSIGMFEHVGRAKLPGYFANAFRLLEPGGLFLNHGIAIHDSVTDGRAAGFMESFIFPDGELVEISDALAFAEDAGFEVRDLENLREHYARTLRCWVQNLEANRARAVRAAGEQSYRAWRLYMAGSAQGFRRARIGLYQSLLGKRASDGTVRVPTTRRDLYAT